MILLKTTFNKKGTIFNQIYKDEEIAIYQLTRQKADDNTQTYSWYEIWKIKIRQKDKYHDDQYERPAYDEAFGTFAWSCSNKTSLFKILKREFQHIIVNL